MVQHLGNEGLMVLQVKGIAGQEQVLFQRGRLLGGDSVVGRDRERKCRDGSHEWFPSGSSVTKCLAVLQSHEDATLMVDGRTTLDGFGG